MPAGSCGRSGIDVDVAQVLHEHRRAFKQRAIRIHNKGASVEYEVVLASHLIDVDHRRPDLGGTATAQLQSGIGFALLVRRTVDRHEHIDISFGEIGDRPALLPDVLTDRKTQPDAVDVHRHRTIARREDAEFVEYTIVRQEMLVIARPYDAVVQYDKPVVWFLRAVLGAHGANDHIERAESVVGQTPRQVIGGVPSSLTEGAPQCEILNGIAREGHLGEHHHLCVVRGGA